MSFVVRMPIDPSKNLFMIYGPFAMSGDAEEFAQFVSREIDPAFVEPLRSPVPELLGWWRSRSGLDQEVPF